MDKNSLCSLGFHQSKKKKIIICQLRHTQCNLKPNLLGLPLGLLLQLLLRNSSDSLPQSPGKAPAQAGGGFLSGGGRLQGVVGTGMSLCQSSEVQARKELMTHCSMPQVLCTSHLPWVLMKERKKNHKKPRFALALANSWFLPRFKPWKQS